jgi:hypothetical protein
MLLDSFIVSVLLAGITGVFLLVCLLLRWDFKRRFREVSNRLGIAERQLRAVQEECKELRRPVAAPPRPSLTAPMGAPASKAPLTAYLMRRDQAIDLHKQGKDAHAIAVDLGMSEGEVKLLLKVHQILQKRPLQ